jgi:hypothetical protein
MDILSVLIACMTVGMQPTTRQCTGRLLTRTETPELSEKFTLSLNDPVEFFRFQSRYRPPAAEGTGVYVLVPVLGDIRDRYVDQDPFNDTLLFTWMIGGVGVEQAFGPWKFSLDEGLIYVKQRYAGNFVHTDEPREPELNRLYDFAQLAGATSAGLAYAPARWLRVEATYARIDLKSRGKVYDESESSVDVRVVAWRSEDAAFGIYGQRYERVSALRRDGNEEGFRLGRIGVFGEL